MTDPFETSAPAAKPRATGVDVRDADARRDGNGRYLIPDLPADYRAQFAAQGYAVPAARATGRTRATTFAKSISDTFTLSAWSQRMVAKGLGMRPDLVVASAAARVDDKTTLDGIVDQAKDAAAARASANVGTAVHTLTEEDDRGQLKLDLVPAPYGDDVRAWREALAAHNLRTDPGYIERSVLNTRWNIAGSFDRLFQLPNGTWVVGDLKTGRNLQYGWNEIAIQLVIYALADAIYDWARDVFLPMPEGLRTDYALVVHLPAGTGQAEVYRVDLRAAAEAADLCERVRAWRSTRNLAQLLTVVDEGPVAETTAQFMDRAFEATDRQVCPLCGETHDGTCATESAQNQPGGTSAPADPLERTTDALGGPLGPPVGPGERGCSRCRRRGHKAGSPKCLEDQDPMILAFRAKAAETMEPIKPGLAAPAEDPSTVEILEASAARAAAPCAHSKGWSISPEGKATCAACGAPGAEPRTEGASKVSSSTVVTVTQDGSTVVDVLEDGGDPFADEPMPEPKPRKVAPRPPTALERILAAASTGEVQAIGKELLAAGKMTDQLKLAGRARMAELAELAG
jgi:hypothetical protein